MKGTVLISGANSGIGICMVDRLSKSGRSVIGLYRKAGDFLKQYPQVSWYQADLSKPDEIESVLKKICKGSVSSVPVSDFVHCAGISENLDFENLTNEVIHNIFQINTFSFIQICQTLFPQFIKRHFGRVVALSSIGVKFGGSRNSIAYSSSKLALEGFVHSLAKLGAKHNVLVNSIRVGITNTDFHKRQGKNMEDRVGLIPLKRMAEPEEIVNLIEFMLSSGASFLTGQDVAVSGGE